MKREYYLISNEDPCLIDIKKMTSLEAQLANAQLDEEAWVTETEWLKGRKV